MNIKLTKTSIVHYFMIYMMILVGGSCLFSVFISETTKFIIFILYVIYGLFNMRLLRIYGLAYMSINLLWVFILRSTIGGIGINSWVSYSTIILSVQYAILYDKKNFLNRFVKIVYLLSLISLFFWALFSIFPSLVNFFPGIRYYVQTLGMGEWAKDYYGKGLLIYSYLEVHPYRNCGIFTEPGVYQITLNSVLFIILFWKNKLFFSNLKQYKRYVFVIIFTIISCQSTSGYIALIFILFFYYIFYHDTQKYSYNIKKFIFLLSSFAVIFLLFDFFINNNNSIIYSQFIQKLFPNGSFDLSQGTGKYRLGMIEYSISLIIKNPFGVGYDVFNAGLNRGDVAASLFVFAAVYGIIPWVITLGFIFYPIIKYEKKYILLLYIIIFLNTTLAQTNLIYTSQLLIPMFVYFCKYDYIKEINETKYEKNFNVI